MKVLVFGDVHGNLPALEELFKRENGNYDLAICHGDVVNYGPWSNECVCFLEALPSVKKLSGNHEENFLRGSYEGKNKVANAFFDHCFPTFNQFDKIKNYGNQVCLNDFRVQHTINGKYYFPDSDLTGLQLQENIIIGHSHYQFARRHDKKRLINTGSIGQNRKFLNIAEYIILDEQSGSVELKSFETDIELVINEMKSQSYPRICLDYYRNKNLKI